MFSLSSGIFRFDILIHITFLFIILFVFFQLVGLKEERKALVSNLKSNSNELLNQNEQFKDIKKQYQEMTPEEQNIYMKFLLAKIEDNNKLHKTKNSYFLALGYLILFLLLGGSFYLGYQLFKKKQINKSQIAKCIINNLILFSVICMIEVLFFFLVILKYQPITNQDINNVFTQTYNQNINLNNNEPNHN